MAYELQPYNPTSPSGSNTPFNEKHQDVIYQQATTTTSSDILSPLSNRFDDNSDAANLNLKFEKVRTGWMPQILRPWSLITFLVIEVGIFFTLIGLYVRASKQQGLSTESESRHYLWTYGPTAVFIFIAAFWRHLDHHIKQLMPWVELANGPKQAQMTVLLDYISPFQPVAFWKACRNGHWLVILSAIAFAILKLATIFATGLFILQGTQLETESENFYRYGDRFAPMNFDPNAVNSKPSYTIFGASTVNLTYPPGTNRYNAFQGFTDWKPGSLDGVMTVSVPTDVFTAKLDCQSARLNWTNDRNVRLEITPLSQFYNTTAFVPGCTLKNLRLDAPSWMGNSSQQGYDGRVQNSTCEEISDPVKGSRLFVAMTYSTREDFTNTLRNYTAFVCEASYAVQRSQITIHSRYANDNSMVSDIQPLANAYTLPDVTGKDITDGIIASLQDSSYQLSSGQWDRTFDPFFTIMSALRPNWNYTEFMEPEQLKTTASELYGALAAQIAKLYLTEVIEDGESVDAIVMRYQQRLVLRPVSVIVMEILVAILIAITVALLIMLPRKGVAPRDPSSIGALATILSRSKELEHSLTGTSNLSDDNLKAWLQRYHFFTTVEDTRTGRTFKVELLDIFPTTGASGTKPQKFDDFETVNISEESRRHSWWKPLGFKWWVIAPLIVFPIAIIITLEILFRRSQSQDGLAVIPANGYVHYTWVYVPAVTMVILVTLFNMVDYATRSIAPYQAMRSKSAIASRGILYNPAGKLTLPALWYAIKERHITVIATTFAVLIAPILTIAVSGLFFSKLVAHVSTLSVQQAEWFNSAGLEYTVNNTDNIITGLIVSSNLSYPTWTYEDLVFPKLGVIDAEKIESADAVTLDVPVIRPTLNCSIIPDDRYVSIRLGQPLEDDESDTPTGNLTSVPVWLNITMPDSCGNTGFIWSNDTFLTQTIDHPETGYFGNLLRLTGASDSSPDRCPDFAVFYGRTEKNKIQNVTTLLCNGWTQSLQARTTFLLPNFTIEDSSPSSPPRRKEETAKWFSNQLVYPGYTFTNFHVATGNTDVLDDFLMSVAFATHGTPPNELAVPETLIKAVTRLYGITAAQTFAQDARIHIEDAIRNNRAGGAVLNTTLTGISRTKPEAKLMQSEASTRVLQILLGFIMVMTIVVYLGVNAKELLPRESNSIATIGGYLAGSDVLRLVPEGAEWKDDGRGGADWSRGYMFGFGWWEDPERGEGRKRYGVGIGKSG